MADATARFALPMLAAGQAQKELFHNEALAIVDAIAHPAALSIGDTSPPATPEPGQCWIVGDAPVGDWAGRSGTLACWTEGGWRFVEPVDGMTVWLSPAGIAARYSGGGWHAGEIAATRLVVGDVQVVGARGAAVAQPVGGGTIDTQARATLAAIISSLVAHGLIAP